MHVLEIFATIESLKVLWADRGLAAYTMQEIWRPLLSHEPLLMDPLNPYCNLADVNSFSSHELIAAAQSPGCFLPFKREAAQFVTAPVGNASDDDDDDDEAEYEDANEEA